MTNHALAWDAASCCYRAPCPCGGTHTVWQYGVPWIVDICGTCGRTPARAEERTWRHEATKRGEPIREVAG